jgi:Glutathione synthase/Ribosomal protein S6 modification enzyme (glutaminyl transferase)
MRHLFVLDPLQRINPAKDSTAALMQAAARAGHELWACTPADLIAMGDAPIAMAAMVQPEPWLEVGALERLPLEGFSVIWMRKDPPVDEAYLYATHLLEVAERAGVRVLNRPSSLRAWNEKLGALRFSRWMAPTLVAGRVAE